MRVLPAWDGDNVHERCAASGNPRDPAHPTSGDADTHTDTDTDDACSDADPDAAADADADGVLPTDEFRGLL